MAGMFYSLEEVADKLNMTEDQVKQIVQQGKLREFRDGPNLLFKVNEVEALAAEAAARAEMAEIEQQPDDVPAQQAEDFEISLADSASGSIFQNDLTNADTSVIKNDEVSILGETESDFAITDDTMADTIASDSKLAQEDEITLASSKADLMLDHSSMADQKALSSFGDDSLPSLNDATSISSLGEEALSSSDQAIKGVDDDVNLDSFGSGSGLLDLSLQADDTSLGGILDEIYTPEGAKKENDLPLTDASSEMNAEADQMLGQESAAPIQAELAAPVAAMAAYAEPEPDSVSNAFGYMMFLPLIAVIYTAIVGITGHMGVRSVIMEQVQGFIWYIMAGVAVLSFLIVGIPWMMSAKPASGTKKVKPEPKAKKEKPAKAPKPAKPAKPEKPKKAKKG